MFYRWTARLATSERQGPLELPENEDPEEECRLDGLPPDFLCHSAGKGFIIV